MNITDTQDAHDAAPVVIVYNNLETFYPFLSRIEDPAILEMRKYRGDRALFWLGKDKLVFTSSPIPDAEMICQRYGYTGVRSATPGKTSCQLSLDILSDPKMIEQIVRHAGPGQAIRLIPYASTQELYRLASYLRERCHLTVSMPESPNQTNLWVRDYIDTKLGFRQTVPSWITDAARLPRGLAVQDLQSASLMIDRFLSQGLDCMVKPDRGESGLGIQFFDHRATYADLMGELKNNAFIDGDHIIVEEYIQPKAGLSPSLELFVPPLGHGDPYITYLSNQQFGQLGRFNGVIISKTYQDHAWYPPLAENGLRIAAHLQKMGYVGNFDLDTIIDAQDQVYLVEMNPRRTGGTHAHEFGKFTFGEKYLDDVTLFSTNRANAPGVTSTDQLFDLLSPVLFPICSEKRGVVITVSSTLNWGDFGCLIAGEDIADVMKIKQEMETLLDPALRRPWPEKAQAYAWVDHQEKRTGRGNGL